MSDIIFVNGMKVKEKFDGLLGVSIKVENFLEFIKEHEENGWVNIDICKSRDKDSWYAKLNTWKPDKVSKKTIVNEFEGQEITEDEIPF